MKENTLSMRHTQDLLGATFRPTKQHGRYFKRVYGGSLYINIVGNKSINVIVIK
jgi:hypothetical protein